MKSQLKKLKGNTIKTSKLEILLREPFAVQNTQFDQIYFNINQSECFAKVYDLEPDISLERFKNQTQNYEARRLISMPECIQSQEFKVKKKQYGIIIFNGLNQGNSLEDLHLKLTDQQITRLTLCLVKSVIDLKKKNFVFSNFRPENIYRTNNSTFHLINAQFMNQVQDRELINQFFWELVEKDHKYWAPQVLDSYSNNIINYVSDIFSIGAIIYTAKYGKYPFQSRFATINSAYTLPQEETLLSSIIRQFLSDYTQRSNIDLTTIEQQLQELLEKQTIEENKKKQEESIKKNNGNSFFNDLSLVFNKMKSDSEGWFLNYVEDDQKEPHEKYLENIIMKMYKKQEKVAKLIQIIQKFIEMNGEKVNPIFKTLLLIGNIFRKGPNHVFLPFQSILLAIKKNLSLNSQIQGFAQVLLQKLKLHEKIKKCLGGNFYLSQITKFSQLTVFDIRSMAAYLENSVKYLKKLILESTTNLNTAIITFFCDQVYFLVSMTIFYVISIRKDNDLQLRNDPLNELIPVQKMINKNLRNISDVSSFVGAHAIYSLQPEYISYQQQIILSRNPYYTSLEHFYRSCRSYKGLTISEDYNRVYAKQEKKEKWDNMPVPKQQKKPSKVYFEENQQNSDEEFDFKIANKKSFQPPKSTKAFEQFGNFNIKPSKSTTKQKNSQKKIRNNFDSGKDSDNNSKASRNQSDKGKKEKTISFQQFGNVKKEEQKKSELSLEFNFFNEINKKPPPKAQIKDRKNIPPKPPKNNKNQSINVFDDFQNIFFKENKVQKPKQEMTVSKKNMEKSINLLQNNDGFNNDIWSMDLEEEKKNSRIQPILSGLRHKQLKDLLKKNQQFVINFNQLVFEKVIGSGSAGDVYLGSYKGEQIAIKKVKAKQNPNALKEFERELVTYIKIKKNPYLVSLIGLSEEKGDFYLLTQFCESGSLFDLLHKKAKEIPLSWTDRLRFAIEIAEGMKCLHQMKPTIIHRDLKSLNVFVRKSSQKWKMKVADFGLSRSPEAQMMTTQLGTIHWMAPELLEGKQYSIKVDVYSYGILLWEILSRKTPYKNLNSPMAILKYVAIDKKRPSLDLIDSECPKEIIEVMERCWEHEPSKRPDFRRIIIDLKEIRDRC